MWQYSLWGSNLTGHGMYELYSVSHHFSSGMGVGWSAAAKFMALRHHMRTQMLAHHTTKIWKVFILFCAKNILNICCMAAFPENFTLLTFKLMLLAIKMNIWNQRKLMLNQFTVGSKIIRALVVMRVRKFTPKSILWNKYLSNRDL